ncbi:hypothetical protein MTR67_026130 [Solanum verrucosum]|uniref:Uncharacterized protein n=1 Tax=Solanum verrucosum TaxID=315347 RepID=A0AAF0R4W1_SOLVR|nr:hypothetical protein MTR67_026130 [Solanum verrucosum]
MKECKDGTRKETRQVAKVDKGALLDEGTGLGVDSCATLVARDYCLLPSEDMSVNESNASKLGNNNDICNFHDVNKEQLGSTGAIRLPPTVGNAVFHITCNTPDLVL